MQVEKLKGNFVWGSPNEVTINISNFFFTQWYNNVLSQTGSQSLG